MEELKYHFTTTLNEDDYVRYVRTLVKQNKNNKRYQIFGYIVIALILAGLCLQYQQYNTMSYYYYVIPLLLAFLLVWYISKGVERNARKIFRTNPIGGDFELSFYDDRVKVRHGQNESTFPNQNIRGIIFTKNDIYLQFSEVWICIRKVDCPQGFVEYVADLEKRKAPR